MGRVFLSSTNKPPFIPFSMGTYENPIRSVFTIKDTKQVKEKIVNAYLVFEDIYCDYVKVFRVGDTPNLDVEFSLDGNNFYKNQIELFDVDAIGKTKVKEILIKFKIIDSLDKFPTNLSVYNITGLKIGVLY